MLGNESILSQFPHLSENRRKELLSVPNSFKTSSTPLEVILDTDTANEIDDQFALAWALLSPKKINLIGVTAEPFSFDHFKQDLLTANALIKKKVSPKENPFVKKYHRWITNLHEQNRDPEMMDFVTPKVGMERSYQEILKIYSLLGMEAKNVFRGSTHYLKSYDKLLENEAVRFIVNEGLKNRPTPLYINCIGCITNVASAILLEPKIINNIVVIWTSAYPSFAGLYNGDSFNLVQDSLAAKLIFESNVALVYLPGYYIGEQLTLSYVEAKKYVQGKGAIGNYLFDLYENNPIHQQRAITDIKRKTWVIWDMLNIAWLVNSDWVPSRLIKTPRLTKDLFWDNEKDTPLMREAYQVDRDAIFIDFFNQLDQLASLETSKQKP